MKMLIAVDFSQVGTEVAHKGYHMAVNSGMDATFFHCAPHASRILEGYDIRAFGASAVQNIDQQKIKNEASLRLDSLIKAVVDENGSAPGAKMDKYVATGDAAEEIIKYAKEKDYDLIVIGYKSYSTIAELLVGSTAAKVARYAPCSVLIYRPDKALKQPPKF